MPPGRCHTRFCLCPSAQSTEPRARSSSDPPCTPSRVSGDPQCSPSPALPGPHPLPAALPSAALAQPCPRTLFLSPRNRDTFGSSTSPFPQRSHLCARHLPASPTRIQRRFPSGPRQLRPPRPAPLTLRCRSQRVALKAAVCLIICVCVPVIVTRACFAAGLPVF